MSDELLPRPTGSEVKLPPVPLSAEQEKLCRSLDDLHNPYELKAKPSDMFRGAIYAIRTACQSNPDCIAQAANSLREILYPFWSAQVKAVADKKGVALEKFGSVLVDEPFIQEVGRVYGILNDLAHHGSNSTKIDFSNYSITDFEQLLADFERIMRDALTRQIDLHSEIDQILSKDPAEVVLTNPVP